MTHLADDARELPPRLGVVAALSGRAGAPLRSCLRSASLWPRSRAPGAVGNARAAAAALSAAVTDRRALVDALDEDVDVAAAGSLSRLGRTRCLELLATRSVGRLAYVPRAGTADIVPVNYTLHGGTVLLRSGPGPKAAAAERGDQVAFEVDDLDEASASGWSVVVVGRLDRLTPAQAQRLEPGRVPEPWAQGPRHVLLRLVPSRIEGRQLW